MKKPPAKRSNTPHKTNQSEIQTTISMQQHEWKGPLPSPASLQEFDYIVPGLANRIVNAWEVESAHRRDIERLDQRSFYRDMLIGKIFALIFVLSALGMAAFAAYLGAEWLGGVIGASTIGAVVWAFVKSQQRNK